MHNKHTPPARFAYNWSVGTPRVVPINFHWNGTEIALGTPPDAPRQGEKMTYKEEKCL